LEGTTSVGVLGDHLYLGTATAELYRVPFRTAGTREHVEP